MDSRYAGAVEQIMLSASLVNARNPMRKYTQKGKLLPQVSNHHLHISSYVEMLEQQQAQLVAGLQELYRRTQDGQGWEGAPLKESSHGIPLTHDILERLGALKPGIDISEPQQFEEDLDSLQRRLLANGAGFIQRTPSDSGSDSGHSPAFEQVPQNVPFTNPFSASKLPPTPPNGSPFPLNASPVLEVKNRQENNPPTSHKALDNSSLQRQLWTSPDMAFDDNMNVLDQYDSPINLNAMPNAFDTAQMPIGTIAPYLSMRDWNHEVDFQRYFSSATM
jgi:hypothetical protein